MAQRITQVDAFTLQPFRGNPAAVCVLEQPADADWMAAVAREMNLSETAFLYPDGEAYRLRWFTPTVEVALCGHATLASAHVLWEEGYLSRDQPARFQTRSGLLTCRTVGDWIEMDFPSEPPQETRAPEALLRALDVTPLFTGKNRMDYLIELESEAAVRAVHPHFDLISELPVRGVIVTSRGSGVYDFVSRFFAPAAGVPEDPATGSAHCCLTPYWAAKLGKQDMLAYQASARGGVVRVGARGERVLLGGQAVTVLRGELVQNPTAINGGSNG
jgi:PhzF family phenazine biosynthesis protein